MRITRIILPLAMALVFGAAALAAAGKPVIVMNGTEKWGKPDMGMQTAVLYGNPDSTGFYVIRLKLGPNWNFPVHYHPTQENVTVISGTFYAGIGDKFDKSKASAFPAGSFASLPPNLKHFAFTKSSGAVIQIEGMGPEKDIMVKGGKM